MDQRLPTLGNSHPRVSPGNWWEKLTALVLIAVMFALGWIVLVSYQPDWLRLPWPEVEVILIIALLSLALVLVSVVALLHTRQSGTDDQ